MEKLRCSVPSRVLFIFSKLTKGTAYCRSFDYFFSASASTPLVATTCGLTAFAHFLAGLMLPARLGVVKLFMLMKDLGILDTLWSLVAIYVALRIPFGIYVTSSL